MKTYDYLIEKQVAWAKSRGLDLIGSKVERGRKVYATSLEANLFEPLSPEVRGMISSGDGQEIRSQNGIPCKMQALHSSSGIALNVFHYWKQIDDMATILTILGKRKSGSTQTVSMSFEGKFSISRRFRYSPNLDIVIRIRSPRTDGILAIESKFTEPFGRKHKGLQGKYLELDRIWDDVPLLRECADSISPADKSYRHLHAAQLIKHILGLKKQYDKRDFELLYLFQDVPGEEGCLHRQEIQRFTEILQMDDLRFRSLSYQELLITMLKKLGTEHQGYLDYVCGRYL